MSVFDKFFERYSYKFPKGYPDFTNKQDILILENILDEIDLFEVSNLTKSELLKYKDKPEKDRVLILIKKIQNNEELELVDGNTFIVDNKEEAIKNLQGEIPSTGVELINKDGNKIKTSKLRKTKEFGGQDAVSTNTNNLKVGTDAKESLVIVFYNILKEKKKLKPFTSESFKNNIKVIKSSSNLYNDVDDTIQGNIETLLNVMESYDTFSTKSKRKAESIFNNPYSIAVELYKGYPNAKTDRGELFNSIRLTCAGITGLPEDKWNPGDIYLVNFSPKLPKEVDSIVPWNKLFVNKWGDRDAPLVSISLKEERYQPGRAKSYLEKFGEEVDYNMSKEEFEYTDDQYKKAIKKYRENIIDYFDNTQPIVKKGNGWEDFPSDRRQLQTKYGAYKLLSLLAGKNDASLAGLFAFGLSIDKDARANPTFWKLVGKNNGSQASRIKYAAGVNTEMAEGEDIVILDNSTNGGFTISGILLKTDGDNTDTEPVKLSFRTTGPGQVQIV
jgi:hypothetical protein